MRAAFRLALRQAEGLIASILALIGVTLPVLDHTTLSRRGRTLRLGSPARAGHGLDLAIDSTSLHVARRRGARCEGWRKLHVAVDPDDGFILAEELARSNVHDTVLVPAMLSCIAGQIDCVFGDDPYAAGRPAGRLLSTDSLPNAEGVFRPKAPDVRAAATLYPLTGRGRHARHVARDGLAAWERATSYGRRNAAELTFARPKRVLGPALRTRSLDAQRVPADIAVRALNRMAALGMPRAHVSSDQPAAAGTARPHAW